MALSSTIRSKMTENERINYDMGYIDENWLNDKYGKTQEVVKPNNKQVVESSGNKQEVGSGLSFGGQLNDFYKNNDTSNSFNYSGASTSSSNASSNSGMADTPNGATGGTTLEQVSADKASYDAFITQYTQYQQYLADNPAIRDQLMNEVTVFDTYFNTMVDRMTTAKTITLQGLQNSYDQTIQDINLSNKLTDEQKHEEIKNATDNFISSHDSLNFSRDAAYAQASKTITKAIGDAANVAAQKYADTLTRGLTGGNIDNINATTISRALKSANEETKFQNTLSQTEIDLNNKKLFKQLEQQVGTEEANKVWDQYTKNQQTSETDNTVLGGVRRFDGLTLGTDVKPVSTGTQTGSIQLNADATSQKNSLSASQALQNLVQGQSGTTNTFQTNLANLEQQKKEAKSSFMESFQDYVPWVQNPNGGFTVGNNAKGVSGAQSTTQRNQWSNSLGKQTWAM